MSMYMSPRHGKRPKKSEPVFKTPMSYSPHVTGNQVRPSPSRIEIWKEQLGLDDTAMTLDESPLSSDDEGDKENRHDTCSLIEYQALQKELDERNSQRDELLLKLKTLSENNKLYKSRLEREETNKKQQMKILKKTHEVTLREKENLVRNLESICEEQESRITELEQTLKGVKQQDGELQNTSLHRLVAQIEKLQEKNTELNRDILTAQAQLETCNNELEQLRNSCEQTDADKSQLQEEIIKLRSSKVNMSTDDQKLVHKLEMANDNLKKDLSKYQLEVTSLKSQLTSQEHLESQKQVTNKLKEENEQLRGEIKELERRLEERPQESEESKEQLKSLTTDNQQLSQQVRSLNAKLLALQAKSPEVITKVKTVEVESEDLKANYATLQLKLKESQQHNVNLESEISESKRQIEEHLSAVSAAQTQVSKLESENDSVKSTLGSEVDRLTKLYEKADQESATCKVTIDELRNQVQTVTCAHDQLSLEKDKAREEMQHLHSQIELYKNQVSETERQMAEDIGILRQAHDEQMAEVHTRHEQQVHGLRHRMNYTLTQLSVIKPELNNLKAQYLSLHKQCLSMPQFIQNTVKETTRQICKSISDINEYNQELITKYRKEMKLRKKYHNQLVELKGNIRVFARVRPHIKEDGGGVQAQNVVAYDQEDDGIINVLNKGRVQTFELDRVFSADVSQEQVYSEVQSLVTSCIDGYNVCIFAYGQTGSGKTYTMEGPADKPGINQRALQQLFTETEERSGEFEYSISVSVLEIYNEMIRDLLSSDPTYKLEVKMSAEGGLHVPGLVTRSVSCVEDVNEVFAIGHKNRATASTNMNEHSSRSHALLCVTVIGKNSTTGTKTMGKLNLVDLAGSERVSKSGADGTRLKEAQSINKSLSCLGDVVQALRSKQSHVPYRNSKLTYLLQDSLGGDSKTLMITQVAPVEKNVGETLASLNFAQRTRAVELGQATKKTESAEIAELKERLAQYEDMAQFTTNGYQKGGKATPSKIARRK